MTTEQSNYLDMCNAVIKHAKDNQATTDLVPAFADGIVVLKTKTGQLSDLGADQSENIKGVTKQKGSQRDTLNILTFQHISPAKAYAFSLKDFKLAEKLDYTPSQLRDIPDESINGTAKNLLDLVNPIIAELAPYLLDPATVGEWQAAIDAHKPAAPRVAISHRVSLTSEIEEKIDEIRTQYEQTLDPISISFKKNNAHYYNDYKNSRKIINLGSRTTRVTGFVVYTTPEGNTKPVVEATLKLNKADLTATTDINGKYVIEKVPIGIDTATVTAPGFQPQTTEPYDLKLGTTQTLNFELIAV